MDKKKILLTGGAGFIGSHLAEELSSSHTVRTLDLEESNLDVESVQGDILDEGTVREALKNIDVVYHLAAQISEPFSLENPKKDCEINVVGTVNLLKYCDEIEKFVYGSTSSVYGPAQYSPVDEGHPTNPSTPYGLSKLCAEKYVQLFSGMKSFDSSIVRLSSPYGPGCKNVINIFFERAVEDKEIKIFGDGKQKRAYLYIEDVVDAYVQFLDKGEGIYNIGHHEEISVNEIAESIVGFTDSESKIVHEKAEYVGINLPTLDCSRAEKELNWKPQLSFEEGLKRMSRSKVN